MNRFIKKVAIAALIVTTAGVAAASQAQANAFHASQGHLKQSHAGGVILSLHGHEGRKFITKHSKGGYQPQVRKKHKGISKYKTNRYGKRIVRPKHSQVFKRKKLYNSKGQYNTYVYGAPSHTRILRRW